MVLMGAPSPSWGVLRGGIRSVLRAGSVGTTPSRARLRAPERGVPAGDGDNGIDLLSALLHGARLALVVGFGWSGSRSRRAIGITSGYYGGRVDQRSWGFGHGASHPGHRPEHRHLGRRRIARAHPRIFALSANGWCSMRVARASTLHPQRGGRLGGAGPSVLRTDECSFAILPNVARAARHSTTAGFDGRSPRHAQLPRSRSRQESFSALRPGSAVPVSPRRLGEQRRDRSDRLGLNLAGDRPAISSTRGAIPRDQRASSYSGLRDRAGAHVSGAVTSARGRTAWDPVNTRGRREGPASVLMTCAPEAAPLRDVDAVLGFRRS